MSLHWTNDLPLALTHIAAALRPDAPFLAALPGGDTLHELRAALQLAELERRGGVAPRVSPLVDVRDVAALLQRAGFALVTVDVEDIVVGYPDVVALMADLGAMGEGNAVHGRAKGPLGRDVLVAAQAVYSALYGNADGTLPATFRIIYMVSGCQGVCVCGGICVLTGGVDWVEEGGGAARAVEEREWRGEYEGSSGGRREEKVAVKSTLDSKRKRIKLLAIVNYSSMCIIHVNIKSSNAAPVS